MSELARDALPTAASRRRLESWKEIAAYLQRSVRTVQLWEKEERLPVHRLQGGVLAYPDELDAWVRDRSISPEAPATAEPRSRRDLGIALGGAAIALAIAVAVWLAWGKRTEVEPIPFAARDWVLIAAVENRTGEPVFDGSIEYLLEHELSTSGFVNVLSSERIADALALMARSPQKLDRVTAREVALRDGNVRAVVATRIEKMGKGYVIGADLIDVERGDRAAAFTREASNHDEIRRAVEGLAGDVRRSLGESLAAARPEPVARVTTRSLRAAQLFTEADRVIVATDDAVAERLLREAIAEDPEFASAYMYLAFALHNQSRPPEEFLPLAERAAELSKNGSEQERLFILGSLASLRGDQDEAFTHYGKLLTIYPDHYWANNNMANILGSRRRSRDAVPYRVKLAALRPNQFIANYVAGESVEYWGERPEEAEPYYARATELLTAKVWNQHPGRATRLRLRKADRAWRDGRLDLLLPELDAAAAQARRNSGPGADALAAGVAEIEIALGRFDRVAMMVRTLEDPDMRSLIAARAAWWSGDRTTARNEYRRLLGSRPALLGSGDFIVIARAGLSQEVSQRLATLPPKPDRTAVQGAIAFERGETDAAAELLWHATQIRFEQAGVPLAQLHLNALDIVIRILEEKGESDRAIEWIERTTPHRVRASMAKAEWIHLQRELARLYRTSGRVREGEQVEARIASVTVTSLSGLQRAGSPER